MEYDLTERQTRKILRTAKTKPGREEGDIKIFYKGRWMNLCREDDCEEVRSSLISDNPVADYLDGEVWGARLDGGDFVVVDSATDG